MTETQRTLQLTGFLVSFRNRHNNYELYQDMLAYGYSEDAVKKQVELDYGQVLQVRPLPEFANPYHYRLLF